jgi:hypothetical protein
MAKKKTTKKKPLGPPTSADPGRLAAWLANPGLRSKLPDALLSPAQRQQREVARDPYHKAIESLTQQKFGGAVTELQGAQKQQDQHTANVGDWFGQYQAELAKSRDRQQALQQAATQSVADRAGSFAAMNNQGIGQEQAAMQADAATRGATVGAQVPVVAQQANTVREALGKQSANTLATQGASNNMAAESALTAAFGEAALAKQGEQNKRASLDDQLRSLLKDRDAFKISAREDLSAADQKAILEAKAFGLDVDQLAVKRRDQEQRRIETRRANRSREDIARENAETARINATKPKKKTGKPTKGLGSRTKANEAAVVKDINAATEAISKGGAKRSDILNAPGGRTPAERRAIANAANDMAKLGYLSPANVRALRALGIHVAGFPRSKDAAKLAGTLPGQKVGAVLEQIGSEVGNLTNPNRVPAE